MGKDGQPPVEGGPLERYAGVFPPHARAIFDEILAERFRQVNAEGFAPVIDDLGVAGRLARAGACYALAAGTTLYVSARDGIELADVWGSDGPPCPKSWTLDINFWKPRGPRRDLVRAAALIFAELERMARLGIDHEKKDFAPEGPR